MLWLTWRQHRWPLITVAAILTVYWTFLVYAGLTGRQALAGCPSWQVAPDWCFDASRSVHGIYTRMNEAAWYGRLLPLVIGVFWGAPLLARELEQGTHRLAFTQSVTRRRWLAVKIGVLAGVAALFGAVTGALVAWARGQYAQMYATRPFGDQEFFASSGAVIPAAMWVAALLAGVMIGLLLRRTVAAMAVTLILLPLAAGGLGLIRPHYLPPVERLADGAQMFFDPGAPNQEQGWVLAISYLDPAG
ncbi:MAG: hypothetical protein IRY92_07650, partial [Dactylosporangium sp.]|nr:hypothetical protein [Dactylosporangium sp.]